VTKVPLLTRPLKRFSFSILLLLPLAGWSQLNDNFSDNDFTTDPTWSGDNSKFVVDNFQLRLQAPAVAGNAYLSTASAAINSAAWEFTLKLDFNPSSTNYVRIYLAADQANLAGPQNGYYVLVGDTPDEVSLYKQTGTSSTKIIDGTDGRVNLSVVNVAVKVTRDDMGNWELFSDPGITGTFTSEGVAADNTFKASSYFGVYCVYTSTRSDRFYFDNFSVNGDPYVDLDPPIVEKVNVVSSNKLVVQFNEALETESSSKSANYQIGNNIGSPTSAILQPDQVSVELNFSIHFQNGVTQSLTLHGVKDIAGNPIGASSHSFLYFNPVPAAYKAIIVTEIFSDPTPQVGLADAEYIEVFNRSDDPYDLAGWVFTDGSSKSTLPNKLILPGEYWIITSTSNVSKFGLTAKVIGAPNFPTLNNSSDTLVIKTPNGILIDSVNYDLSWYRNPDKQEGGWSLELIDTNNTCAEEENWTSSENETGGTPGLANSVSANKPDLTGPQLSSVVVISPDKLLLSFNEKLESPIDPRASFDFMPTIQVKRYYFESKSLRSIVLELSDVLSTKQLYKLVVNNLFDCSGNRFDIGNETTFALPERAETGDIIVNEILLIRDPTVLILLNCIIAQISTSISMGGTWEISRTSKSSIQSSFPPKTKSFPLVIILYSPAIH